MDYPKISIVTPSYNQGKYLEATIQSVLNQDYPNLQYVIIDGGSTDDSIEIIRKYQSRLKFWESKSYPTASHYCMVQDGFQHCDGEIMAWINSDDIYHPKAFFTVAEILSKYSDIHWLTGNPSFIDDMGRITYCTLAHRWCRSKLLIEKFTTNLQQESTFWRRSLWEKTGAAFDTAWLYAADFALWVKFSRFAKLYTTEAMLGAFRQRGENQKTIEKWNDYQNEVKQIIKKENPSCYEKMLGKFFKRGEVLIKAPFINPDGLINKVYNKIYKVPSVLKFDRMDQTFKL